jgi:hypothetical protein
MVTAAVVAGLVAAVSATSWADTRNGAARSSTPVAKAAASTKTKKPPAGKSYGTYDGHAIVIPDGLEPPADTELFDVFVGRGTLVYTCTGQTFSQANDPALTVFTLDGKPVGIHFAPLAWQSTEDGSRVDAVVVKEVPTAGTVTSVLLVAGNVNGGGGSLGKTADIVRLPIEGGLPPSDKCSKPGERVGSPFTTLYLFFKKS